MLIRVSLNASGESKTRAYVDLYRPMFSEIYGNEALAIQISVSVT